MRIGIGSGRLVFAAMVISVGSAACGSAQAQGFSSGNPADRALGNFWLTHRDQEENPTGMGKPGEFWSLPTGTRIYRGPSQRSMAKAAAPLTHSPGATDAKGDAEGKSLATSIAPDRTPHS